MRSLYAQYLMERTHDYIIETPDSFITYRLFDDGKTAYIVDIFVSEDMRKLGEASRLANMVAKVVKEAGYTELIGTVVPSAKNSTESLKVLLAYGMKLKSATNDCIIFRKDL